MYGYVTTPYCHAAPALVAPKVLLLIPAGDRVAVKIENKDYLVISLPISDPRAVVMAENIPEIILLRPRTLRFSFTLYCFLYIYSFKTP